MQDVGASEFPQLQLNALTVPSSGEVARAGQLRALAQRMLDNDAALAALIASAGAVKTVHEDVTVYQATDASTWADGDRSVTRLTFTGQVALLAIIGLSCGFGGRVTAYRSLADFQADEGRAIEVAPTHEGVFADIATGYNGSNVDLDRPHIVRLYPDNGSTGIWLGFESYGGIQSPANVVGLTYAVLAMDSAIPQAT